MKKAKKIILTILTLIPIIPLIVCNVLRNFLLILETGVNKTVRWVHKAVGGYDVYDRVLEKAVNILSNLDADHDYWYNKRYNG